MEVCIDSVQSAMNAKNGGAKRVELCSNLLEGGTTPSIGLLTVTKLHISLPVFAMVRPRGGDFLYTNEEFAVMVEDVKQLIKAGADGIVFGVLTKDGEVDTLRCRDLLDIIKPVPVTFHRAFDMVRDQTEALETIIKLGFDRVLTSGGKSDASQGMKCIKELVEQAEDRIIVMPGGGINENNLEQLLRVTGAKEFHGSARTRVDSEIKYCRSSISMGASGQEYGQMIANVERIKHMVKIAKTLGF